MVEGNIFLNFNKEVFESSTAFYSDVTQRVLAENSLIASEKKYRELFNVSPVPMWVVCPITLEIVQVN